MSSFPFVHRETVRFADLDGFGHANNAAYSTYLEQARIAFLRERGLIRGATRDDMTMILARLELDFRGQLRAGDELEIGVRTTRVGTKSFELEYEIRCDGRLVAEARTVLVGYDYGREATVTIPGEWRRRLA